MITKDAVKALIEVVRATGEIIRELKQVPSGHLYASMMGHLSLDDYNIVIGVLKDAGLVVEKNYLLIWVGPPVEGN